MTVSGPLVSVVIPTHNRAALLQRAIQSVLGQSYPNLELFVVDDASTDDTPAVVQTFRDSRLKYIRLADNRRAAAARNVGIREARGEFLAFLDDDDWWHEDKLAKQVPTLLAAPAVGLNLCGHVRLLRDGTEERISGPEAFERMDFGEGFSWNFALIATPGWLVRRSALERSGLFDERMRCWDDWELALRLREVCEFAHLDETLFTQDRRRQLGGGMWDNERWFANDMTVIMERHARLWQSRPDIVSRHLSVIARGKLVTGDNEGARSAYVAAWKARPSNLKALVLSVATSLGPIGATLARQGLAWMARMRA